MVVYRTVGISTQSDTHDPRLIWYGEVNVHLLSAEQIAAIYQTSNKILLDFSEMARCNESV